MTFIKRDVSIHSNMHRYRIINTHLTSAQIMHFRHSWIRIHYLFYLFFHFYRQTALKQLVDTASYKLYSDPKNKETDYYGRQWVKYRESRSKQTCRSNSNCGSY